MVISSVGIGLGLGLGRDLDGMERNLDNEILMSGICPKIIYKNKFQILYPPQSEIKEGSFLICKKII